MKFVEERKYRGKIKKIVSWQEQRPAWKSRFWVYIYEAEGLGFVGTTSPEMCGRSWEIYGPNHSMDDIVEEATKKAIWNSIVEVPYDMAGEGLFANVTMGSKRLESMAGLAVIACTPIRGHGQSTTKEDANKVAYLCKQEYGDSSLVLSGVYAKSPNLLAYFEYKSGKMIYMTPTPA